MNKESKAILGQVSSWFLVFGFWFLVLESNIGSAPNKKGYFTLGGTLIHPN